MIDAINFQTIGNEWIYPAAGFLCGALAVAVIMLYRRVVLVTKLETKKDLIQSLEQENRRLNQALQAAREKAVRLESEKNSFQQQVVQHKEDLKEMEKTFLNKFENLSNKIFEEKNSSFKKQSRESIGEILNPLKEKLNDFQKKVDDSFGKQANEQFSLKEQIKNIVDVHQKMSVQAENLTKALTSDSKAQGNWGEIKLEKILEDAGLEKGVDYSVQGKKLKLKHLETGRHQQPDVIIHLPENKHIIVDSKVTLTFYEKFCAEEDEELRSDYLKKFIASVREKVKELETRRYQDTESLGTPEIVLMFMPIEGAFMLALQEDRELHQFAWNKRVAIVGTSTLFATLKTIDSLWRMAKQNQNALEIARQGGALYDKIEGLVVDMGTLRRQLNTVDTTYENAMRKLKGHGGILGKTEKLKQLGAKTSKTLPADLIDVDEIFENEKTIEASDEASDDEEKAA